MKALNMSGVILKDKINNIVIREQCGVKKDVVIKIKKEMLRWIEHIERMDRRRLTKEIYVS